MAYIVKRDNKKLKSFNEESEAFHYLHQIQPSSVSHATTYEGYKIEEVKEKSKRVPKTREVFVIQGNYGQGWEDVTEETSYFGARNRLKEYNENENNGHRLIRRRVPYFEISESDKKNNEKESEDYFNSQIKRRMEK